jgi:hypothetical protein
VTRRELDCDTVRFADANPARSVVIATGSVPTPLPGVTVDQTRIGADRGGVTPYPTADHHRIIVGRCLGRDLRHGRLNTRTTLEAPGSFRR